MNTLTQLRETALHRRNQLQEHDEDEQTLLGQAVQTALTPLRVATSRPAIKAYLTTFLFLLTSFVLISLSTTAYFLFYYNYVPQIGSKETVHLQYEVGKYPYAVVNLDTSSLISLQPYDVFISLSMPRTPSNQAAGNFMLDLSFLPDPAVPSGPLSYLLNTTDPRTTTPLARSRRPAILPYSSYVTSLSHKLLHLPVHLLSFKDLDAAELKVSMFERLSFARGKGKIPTTAYIEVQSQTPPTGCPPSSQPTLGLPLLSSSAPVSTSTLQIYSAQLLFHARFEGLRYYVYNYRVLSFIVFTSLFYGFALGSMAVAYAFIMTIISGRNPNSKISTATGIESRVKSEDSATSTGPSSTKIKTEGGEKLQLDDIKAEDESNSDVDAAAALSGTERTFPSIGRQSLPLKYTPGTTTTAPSDDAEAAWSVQRDDATHDAEDEEDDDNEDPMRIITPVSGSTLDVKDESDDETEFRGDSGIGTSMESEAATGGLGLVRRKSSRGGGRGSGGSGSAGRGK